MGYPGRVVAMALFDPERERIVIRVVYDGPGHAGKTTNLARLCRAFASWRRSEMVSPATLGERTQYFDWLEVDGGLLASYPIRAQLLTVPGQRELTLRRKFVIERADVVVFVADSQPDSVAESRAFYAELCEQLAAFPDEVPIILQANKQDLPGAIKPPALAKAISQGLRAPAHVFGSVATTDQGVKQTLTIALKLGSDLLRKRLAGSKVQSIAGAVGDAAGTFAALEHHEASLARERLGSTFEPPRPSSSLPNTHLWPGVTGRTLLRSLDDTDLRRVSDPDDLEQVVLEARGWRLSTGAARRFDTDEAGLAVLAQSTRRKVALAGWLPEPCAVALQTDPAGTGAWLWTIDPILPSLADELEASEAGRRQQALARFAEVITGALAIAETRGLIVDLDPACFGVQADEGDRDRTRYVGERLDWGGELPGVVDVVFGMVERFGSEPLAIAEFAETLCMGLRSVPIDGDRRVALQREFIAADPRSRAAARVRDTAVMALARPARE
jgi:signal recognition particle receptor subunit beta